MSNIRNINNWLGISELLELIKNDPNSLVAQSISGELQRARGEEYNHFGMTKTISDTGKTKQEIQRIMTAFKGASSLESEIIKLKKELTSLNLDLEGKILNDSHGNPISLQLRVNPHGDPNFYSKNGRLARSNLDPIITDIPLGFGSEMTAHGQSRSYTILPSVSASTGHVTLPGVGSQIIKNILHELPFRKTRGELGNLGIASDIEFPDFWRKVQYVFNTSGEKAINPGAAYSANNKEAEENTRKVAGLHSPLPYRSSVLGSEVFLGQMFDEILETMTSSIVDFKEKDRKKQQLLQQINYVGAAMRSMGSREGYSLAKRSGRFKDIFQGHMGGIITTALRELSEMGFDFSPVSDEAGETYGFLSGVSKPFNYMNPSWSRKPYQVLYTDTNYRNQSRKYAHTHGANFATSWEIRQHAEQPDAAKKQLNLHDKYKDTTRLIPVTQSQLEQAVALEIQDAIKTGDQSVIEKAKRHAFLNIEQDGMLLSKRRLSEISSFRQRVGKLSNQVINSLYQEMSQKELQKLRKEHNDETYQLTSQDESRIVKDVVRRAVQEQEDIGKYDIHNDLLTYNADNQIPGNMADAVEHELDSFVEYFRQNNFHLSENIDEDGRKPYTRVGIVQAYKIPEDKYTPNIMKVTGMGGNARNVANTVDTDFTVGPDKKNLFDYLSDVVNNGLVGDQRINFDGVEGVIEAHKIKAKNSIDQVSGLMEDIFGTFEKTYRRAYKHNMQKDIDTTQTQRQPIFEKFSQLIKQYLPKNPAINSLFDSMYRYNATADTFEESQDEQQIKLLQENIGVFLNAVGAVDNVLSQVNLWMDDEINKDHKIASGQFTAKYGLLDSYDVVRSVLGSDGKSEKKITNISGDLGENNEKLVDFTKQLTANADDIVDIIYHFKPHTVSYSLAQHANVPYGDPRSKGGSPVSLGTNEYNVEENFIHDAQLFNTFISKSSQIAQYNKYRQAQYDKDFNQLDISARRRFLHNIIGQTSQNIDQEKFKQGGGLVLSVKDLSEGLDIFTESYDVRHLNNHRDPKGMFIADDFLNHTYAGLVHKERQKYWDKLQAEGQTELLDKYFYAAGGDRVLEQLAAEKYPDTKFKNLSQQQRLGLQREMSLAKIPVGISLGKDNGFIVPSPDLPIGKDGSVINPDMFILPEFSANVRDSDFTGGKPIVDTINSISGIEDVLRYYVEYYRDPTAMSQEFSRYAGDKIKKMYLDSARELETKDGSLVDKAGHSDMPNSMQALNTPSQAQVKNTDLQKQIPNLPPMLFVNRKAFRKMLLPSRDTQKYMKDQSAYYSEVLFAHYQRMLGQQGNKKVSYARFINSLLGGGKNKSKFTPTQIKSALSAMTTGEFGDLNDSDINITHNKKIEDTLQNFFIDQLIEGHTVSTDENSLFQHVLKNGHFLSAIWNRFPTFMGNDVRPTFVGINPEWDNETGTIIGGDQTDIMQSNGDVDGDILSQMQIGFDVAAMKKAGLIQSGPNGVSNAIYGIMEGADDLTRYTSLQNAMGKYLETTDQYKYSPGEVDTLSQAELNVQFDKDTSRLNDFLAKTNKKYTGPYSNLHRLLYNGAVRTGLLGEVDSTSPQALLASIYTDLIHKTLTSLEQNAISTKKSMHNATGDASLKIFTAHDDLLRNLQDSSSWKSGEIFQQRILDPMIDAGMIQSEDEPTMFSNDRSQTRIVGALLTRIATIAQGLGKEKGRSFLKDLYGLSDEKEVPDAFFNLALRSDNPNTPVDISGFDEALSPFINFTPKMLVRGIDFVNQYLSESPSTILGADEKNIKVANLGDIIGNRGSFLTNKYSVGDHIPLDSKQFREAQRIAQQFGFKIDPENQTIAFDQNLMDYLKNIQEINGLRTQQLQAEHVEQEVKTHSSLSNELFSAGRQHQKIITSTSPSDLLRKLVPTKYSSKADVIVGEQGQNFFEAELGSDFNRAVSSMGEDELKGVLPSTLATHMGTATHSLLAFFIDGLKNGDLTVAELKKLYTDSQNLDLDEQGDLLNNRLAIYSDSEKYNLAKKDPKKYANNGALTLLNDYKAKVKYLGKLYPDLMKDKQDFGKKIPMLALSAFNTLFEQYHSMHAQEQWSDAQLANNFITDLRRPESLTINKVGADSKNHPIFSTNYTDFGFLTYKDIPDYGRINQLESELASLGINLPEEVDSKDRLALLNYLRDEVEKPEWTKSDKSPEEQKRYDSVNEIINGLADNNFTRKIGVSVIGDLKTGANGKLKPTLNHFLQQLFYMVSDRNNAQVIQRLKEQRFGSGDPRYLQHYFQDLGPGTDVSDKVRQALEDPSSELYKDIETVYQTYKDLPLYQAEREKYLGSGLQEDAIEQKIKDSFVRGYLSEESEGFLLNVDPTASKTNSTYYNLKSLEKTPVIANLLQLMAQPGNLNTVSGDGTSEGVSEFIANHADELLNAFMNSSVEQLDARSFTNFLGRSQNTIRQQLSKYINSKIGIRRLDYKITQAQNTGDVAAELALGNKKIDLQDQEEEFEKKLVESLQSSSYEELQMANLPMLLQHTKTPLTIDEEQLIDDVIAQGVTMGAFLGDHEHADRAPLWHNIIEKIKLSAESNAGQSYQSEFTHSSEYLKSLSTKRMDMYNDQMRIRELMGQQTQLLLRDQSGGTAPTLEEKNDLVNEINILQNQLQSDTMLYNSLVEEGVDKDTGRVSSEIQHVLDGLENKVAALNTEYVEKKRKVLQQLLKRKEAQIKQLSAIQELIDNKNFPLTPKQLEEYQEQRDALSTDLGDTETQIKTIISNTRAVDDNGNVIFGPDNTTPVNQIQDLNELLEGSKKKTDRIKEKTHDESDYIAAQNHAKEGATVDSIFNNWRTLSLQRDMLQRQLKNPQFADQQATIKAQLRKINDSLSVNGVFQDFIKKSIGEDKYNELVAESQGVIDEQNLSNIQSEKGAKHQKQWQQLSQNDAIFGNWRQLLLKRDALKRQLKSPYAGDQQDTLRLQLKHVNEQIQAYTNIVHDQEKVLGTEKYNQLLTESQEIMSSQSQADIKNEAQVNLKKDLQTYDLIKQWTQLKIQRAKNRHQYEKAVTDAERAGLDLEFKQLQAQIKLAEKQLTGDKNPHLKKLMGEANEQVQFAIDNMNSPLSQAREQLSSMSQAQQVYANAGNSQFQLWKLSQQQKTTTDPLQKKILELEYQNALQENTVNQLALQDYEHRHGVNSTQKSLAEMHLLGNQEAYMKTGGGGPQGLIAQKGLLGGTAAKFKGTLKYLLGTYGVMTFIRSFMRNIKLLMNESIQLDGVMTNLRIVTGQNKAETRNLITQYSELADTLGATTKEVSTSAIEWMRQGYEAAEVTDLVTSSMYLSKLGMLDSASATKDLTSALKGFKMQAAESMTIVDKLTALDLKAATSAGEIAEGLSKFANLGSLAGVDIDQAAAYVATIADVTQMSGTSAGQALKTIISRYGNVKAGAYEKLNLSTSTSAEQDQSYVNDIERVLRKLGINTRKDNLNFRDFDEILEEIAGRWNSLDTVSQKAVANAFAGVRQQEAFVTLMQNWDKYSELLEVSQNSQGTAEHKYEAYRESYGAAKNQLVAAIEKVANEGEFSDLLVNLIYLLTKIVKILPKIVRLLPALFMAVEQIKGLSGNSYLNKIFNSTKFKTFLKTISTGTSDTSSWSALGRRMQNVHRFVVGGKSNVDAYNVVGGLPEDMRANPSKKIFRVFNPLANHVVQQGRLNAYKRNGLAGLNDFDSKYRITHGVNDQAPTTMPDTVGGGTVPVTGPNPVGPTPGPGPVPTTGPSNPVGPTPGPGPMPVTTITGNPFTNAMGYNNNGELVWKRKQYFPYGKRKNYVLTKKGLANDMASSYELLYGTAAQPKEFNVGTDKQGKLYYLKKDGTLSKHKVSKQKVAAYKNLQKAESAHSSGGGAGTAAAVMGAQLAVQSLMSGLTAYAMTGNTHTNYAGETVNSSDEAKTAGKAAAFGMGLIPFVGPILDQMLGVSDGVMKRIDFERDNAATATKRATENLSALKKIDPTITTMQKNLAGVSAEDKIARDNAADEYLNGLLSEDNKDNRKNIERYLDEIYQSLWGIEGNSVSLYSVVDDIKNGNEEERDRAMKAISIAQLKEQHNQERLARTQMDFNETRASSEDLMAYRSLDTERYDENGLERGSVNHGGSAAVGTVGGAATAGLVAATVLYPGVIGKIALGVTSVVAAIATGLGAYFTRKAEYDEALEKEKRRLDNLSLGEKLSEVQGDIDKAQKTIDENQEILNSDTATPEEKEAAKKAITQNEELIRVASNTLDTLKQHGQYLEKIASDENKMRIEEGVLAARVRDNDKNSKNNPFLMDLSTEQVKNLGVSGVYESVAMQVESSGGLANGNSIIFKDSQGNYFGSEQNKWLNKIKAQQYYGADSAEVREMLEKEKTSGRIDKATYNLLLKYLEHPEQFTETFSQDFLKHVDSALYDDPELRAIYTGEGYTLKEALQLDKKDIYNQQILERFADALGVTVDELETFKDDFGELTLSNLNASIPNLIQEYEKYDGLLDSLVDGSQSMVEITSTIIKEFPELIQYLGDMPTLIDKVTEKIKEISHAQIMAQWDELSGNTRFFKDVARGNMLNSISTDENDATRKKMDELLTRENITSLDDLRKYINGLDSNDPEQKELREKLEKMYMNAGTGVELNSDIYHKRWTKYIEYQSNLLSQEVEQLKEQRTVLEGITKQREYENKLIEARIRLEDARNNKQRVFRSGIGFVYEADQTAIREAQQGLEELDVQKKISGLDAQITALEDAQAQYKELLSAPEDELAKLEAEAFEREYLQHMGDSADTINVTASGIKATTDTISTNIVGLKDSVDIFKTDFNTISEQILSKDKEERQAALDNVSALYKQYRNTVENHPNDLTAQRNAQAAYQKAYNDAYGKGYITEEFLNQNANRGADTFGSKESVQAATEELKSDETSAIVDKNSSRINIDSKKIKVTSTPTPLGDDDQKAKWLVNDVKTSLDKDSKGDKRASIWAPGIGLGPGGTEFRNGMMDKLKPDADTETLSDYALQLRERGVSEAIIVGSYDDDEWAWIRDGRAWLAKATAADESTPNTWQGRQFAKGTTDSGNTGLNLLNELGTEAIITPHGTITALPSHSGVVPADITKNLWGLGEVAPQILRAINSGYSSDYNLSRDHTSLVNDDSFNITNLNMSVTADNSFDPDAFVQAIKMRATLTKHHHD